MDNGRWSAIQLWVGRDVRRRWKALVVLAILAGATAALSMAALAGARRTETALERLRDRTHAADAIVFASQSGVRHPDWAKLAAQPEVKAVAVWGLLFGDEDGEPDGLLFVSMDGKFGDQVTRPVLSDGRMWDTAAPDEVIVTPSIAGSLPVGSTFTYQPFGHDQPDDAQVPTGPEVTFRVVGVGSTINRFLFAGDQIYVGPGFVAEYGSQIIILENADVQLHNGADDIVALQRDADSLIGSGTPLLDLNAVSRRVDTALSVERAALLVMAAAVAVAGGLLVAQALARSASSVAEDELALRALGMSGRDMVAAGVASHLPVAILSAAVAAGGSIFASRFFPVGMGRQIDPRVGTHGDLAVIVPGTLLVAGLVLAGAAVVASRASRGPRSAAVRPSALVASIRANSSVSIGIGAAMALDPGAGRSRVAVRPALIGAVVGVLGLVATLTLGHSVTDALAHPERAGVTWDAMVSPQFTDYGATGLTSNVLSEVAAAVPPGSGLTEAARATLQVGGIGVPTFLALPYGTGPTPEFTLIAGRGPGRIGEAAIGPKTAQDLNVGIGDTVDIDSGSSTAQVTVVGEALFPSDVHAQFDEGLWITAEEFTSLVIPMESADVFQGPERAILVAFPDDLDPAAALASTSTALGDAVQYVSPAEFPVELDNLRNVRTLPLVLAAFLALLAVAAVTHVLLSTSRRRRRDFAVLRALGCTRASTRRIVRAQATVIAIVGLLVGIPLGLAVGRFGWHLVAERVPLRDVASIPVLTVAVVVPAALIVMNALAMWPARSVGRLHPAETLREE